MTTTPPTNDARRGLQYYEIARVAHELNRAYCMALGDFSLPPWEQAPPPQRDSLIAGVKAIDTGTALTVEDQHRQWVERKLAEGWTLGPLNREAKTHPNLRPRDELPPNERRKDLLFRGVVQILLLNDV